MSLARKVSKRNVQVVCASPGKKKKQVLPRRKGEAKEDLRFHIQYAKYYS